MNRNIAVIAVVLLVPLLAGGVIGYSIGRNGPARPPEQAAGENASAVGDPFTGVRVSSPGADLRDSLSDAIGGSRRNAITRTVAMVSPAVVGINVTEVRQYRYRSPWGDDPFFRQFFGDQTYSERVQGLGSGFLISPDGYVVTNDHVAGNAKEITVTLTSGEKYKADLIGTDQVADIALLKIDGKNLPSIRLGNSDDVIIGEWAIAFGNPFGLFDISDRPTVTVGVVSATKMNLRAEERRVYRGMIQTDAAINAGNSGGPLVNSLGEVIGVNAVIYTPNQGSIGLGFAIPVNRVKAVIAELKKSGKIERGFWTGLEIQTVDERVARYFGLDRAEGVIVSDVKRNSPAERAGFRVGDIIVAANGEKVVDGATLMADVDDAKAGDTMNLTVIRDRRTMDIKLKLEKR
ncbi:MAG TPA: trypsin-like peptidase domain-containing protein [Bacteroidota bacterium]|nr:trypsin-like peptidase domain-containing protein [Bacteroidota bacterium]